VTAIGRLKKRSEYLFAKGGTRFATPSFVLQARRRLPNSAENRKMARFGFTATKRLGGAVTRNRARRRLKEAVRLAAVDQAIEGYDYVLIARGGAVQRPFTEVIKDLQRAMNKVHEPSSGKRHRKSPSA
jgi:ribonuclease P protein component